MTGSWLGRRNPSVKLGLAFAVSLAVSFVLTPTAPAVLYVLALLAVRLTSRVPWRRLALAHVPFVAFASGALLVNAVSRPGTVLWAAGSLEVTDAGLSVGAALAARTLLIGVLAVGFVVSTDPVDLMTSLQQNARLSPRVTYALLAGHRLLQELPREWQTIRMAHAVRAPLRADGRPEAGVRAFTRAAFALLVVCVRRGERTAQALESRGLGVGPRTVWRPVRVDRTDVTMAATVLSVVPVVVLML
ncbi:hypothetical protein GCM10011376_13370 [Nocardioides flavus (ex Wang et al. 2016)]|uniref:Energy-coupling factor transport system permease protein n=1 Tax=Nocardioides flavus (ex Wang et al. 2016) TaxID=2058780 RepID=A0ABQ3HJV7_9ACTN|nr:energy-coupling factor transporter transmembrane component T [Nocardioides flavus (ex Wang et al. 2016)]GHE16727.1 hypothetical protein GCM10011376_13370 [Nocardioides flavus (ex Wang et al. 2016)]